MRIPFYVLVTLFYGLSLSAQDYFPINDGVKAENNNFTAFINAKIHITPTKVLEKGTLLIQKGKVIETGKNVQLPKNTVLIDLNGKSIYPSFIDIYSDFGVAKPKPATSGGRSAQYGPSREGYYWNDHIMPENDAISKFNYDRKKAKELREAGFGVVNTHIQDGIARGNGALISLNDIGSDSDRVLADKSAQYFSLTKSVAKRQAYPTSLMGALALLRQMYFDADWYAQGNVTTKDLSLEALNTNKSLVQIIEAKDKDNILRVDKIGDMFNINYTILAGGNEFESVAEIKATNANLIVPINFPDPFDVSDPYLANHVSLEDMRYWNQAPTNPKVLAENNITFGLTLHGQKSTSAFRKNLLKAIAYGLSKTEALEALTTAPAQILGKSNLIGSLQSGSQANFLITSGDIFEEETVLYENWVQGQKHIIKDKELIDIRGNYNLAAGEKVYQLSITGDFDQPKAEVKEGEDKLTSKIEYGDNWLSISFNSKSGDQAYRLSGMATSSSDILKGKLLLPNGTETTFKATKTSAYAEKEKDKSSEKPKVVPITFPNIGYGYSQQPKQESVLFKNATVWTSEDEGILEHTDVLVKNGKIAKIGVDLKPSGATIVDATGKHLTAGIIDEHTHIACR